MNLVWSALVIVVTAALAVTAMLLVRRGAPEGSRFIDGDRASGVFGVLATGFSVLLGFVVFLAFESYDQSRSGAEAEALVLSQQVETAQFSGAPVDGELTGELVCYGRSVVHIEWPRTESGTQGDEINPWGSSCSAPSDGPAQDAERGGGLWKVARPDVRPRTGPDRPDPRRRRRDPDAALDRVDPHLHRDLRFHVVLRRPRRRGRDPGRPHGVGRHGHRLDAAPDCFPPQPVPRGARRGQSGGDGAHARGSSTRMLRAEDRNAARCRADARRGTALR